MPIDTEPIRSSPKHHSWRRRDCIGRTSGDRPFYRGLTMCFFFRGGLADSLVATIVFRFGYICWKNVLKSDLTYISKKNSQPRHPWILMVNWGVFFSGEHFPTKAFFALFKPRRVSWKRLSNIIFTTPFRWRQFTFFCVFLPPSLAAKKKLKAMIKQRKENESPASFLVRMGEKNRTICEKLPAVSSFCKKNNFGEKLHQRIRKYS